MSEAPAARQATRFLRALFGHEVSGHVILFTLPDRGVRSFPVPEIEHAGNAAAQLADDSDVYFAMGLQGKSPTSGRGRAAGVAAIPGLWLDLDMRAPYRNRTDLPASVDDARRFLDLLPLRPTCIVHSGGGLYPLWIFKEPWTFASDSERSEAARVSQGWQEYVCEAAASRGWNLDNTSDLARVLRLPGTVNHKGDAPTPVRLIDTSGPRWARHDFHEFIVERPERESSPAENVLPIEVGTPRGTRYIRAAFERECSAVASAAENHRNNTLNRAAFALARFCVAGLVEESVVREALLIAGRAANRPGWDPFPDSEIHRTISSAFSAREVAA